MQEPTGLEEREKAALAELGRRRVWFRAIVQLASILTGVAAGFVVMSTVVVKLVPPPDNPYRRNPYWWMGLICIAVSVTIFFIIGTFVARRLVRLRTRRWIADVAGAWQLREEQLAETIRLSEQAKL